MIRARASASATREVSIVIQRRPHCSAAKAVVPEPQVGSRTRSPGSVVISRQRSITLGLVCTTYIFFSPNVEGTVSVQMLFIMPIGKSFAYLLYFSQFPTATSLFLGFNLSNPSLLVFQW